MLEKARNTFLQIRIILTLSIALIEEKEDVNDDKEKYRDILLEGGETVLSFFGFDRTAYGDAPKKYKKRWQRLREERLRERNTEAIYH
jgi:general stress protein YciG